MALLIRFAGLAGALSACYSPDLRDCTVTCASVGDCARGQVCGVDRLCAAPAIANQCRRLVAMDDAGGHDTGSIAPPAPDAGHVLVHITIHGGGTVVADGAVACTSLDAKASSCDLDALAGVTLMLEAAPSTSFDHWDGACTGPLASCALTPAPPDAHVEARFTEGG
jgi:hypothetical protein